MTSLYNKRPAPQFNMPNAAFNVNSGLGDVAKTASKVLGAKAQEYADKAQENFNLGKSELINTLLDDAYKVAPDNIEQFNSIIQENLTSSIEGLPQEMQENVISSVRSKKELYNVKVFENRKKSIDTERTGLVLSNIEQEDTSTLAAQESMYQSLIDGDKEVFNVAKESYNSSLNNTMALTEATNMKGNYILNDKAARTLRQAGQFGQMDSFAKVVDELSLNDLKDFDKTTFQDKKAYMDKMGVDRKTYKAQETYITKRRKSLGDKKTRVINNQAYFTAAKQLTHFNPEELSALKENDIVSKKFIKLVKKSQEIDVNPIFAQETTGEAFSSAINSLNKVLMNKTGETSKEYRSKILEIGAEADNELKEMSQTLGITEEDQNMFSNAISSVMLDNDGTLDKILEPYMKDDNATSMTLAMKFANPLVSAWDGTKNILKRVGEIGYDNRAGGIPTFNKKFSENDNIAIKAKEIAQNGFKVALEKASTGNYEEAEKVFQETNRMVIRKLNSNIISEQELIRLEKAKASSVDAITEINGQYYDFEGYDNYQPIFKRR